MNNSTDLHFAFRLQVKFVCEWAGAGSGMARASGATCWLLAWLLPPGTHRRRHASFAAVAPAALTMLPPCWQCQCKSAQLLCTTVYGMGLT